jgi:hypothetical protein
VPVIVELSGIGIGEIGENCFLRCALAATSAFSPPLMSLRAKRRSPMSRCRVRGTCSGPGAGTLARRTGFPMQAQETLSAEDAMLVVPDTVEIDIGPDRLQALLGVPAGAGGLVIFAHGSGSGRLSPRNNRVAAALREAGLATLLLDLLTPDEERDRANVFDIPLLATRLSFAADWSRAQTETAHLPIGYFGASTGAGAALVAASAPRAPVQAVV